MNTPLPTAPVPLNYWNKHGRRLLRRLRNSLILYAVVGLIGSAGSLFVSVTPSFDSSPVAAVPDFSKDVAGSWNRFNAGDSASASSWTLDEMKEAAGDLHGGQLVAMRGNQSVIDTAQVEKAVAGTRVAVILTPPTPLGASETTRLRGNSAQQRWADELGVVLVLVHGQQVILPSSKIQDRISFALPDAGVPVREAMRTGEITSTVVSVVNSAAERPETAGPKDPGPLDAAAVALRGTRAPAPAELAPVTRALDAGALYADPSITDPPRFSAGWSGIGAGRPVKVVLLPLAGSGPPIDWTTPLGQRYPDATVLVMTGKWIESTGVDRDLVLAAMWQTYAVGQYALASSPPAYGEILDWVAGVAGIAAAADSQRTALPAAAPGGIPRWLSYLVLGTSLLIATAFGVQQLRQRRRAQRPSGGSRGAWRDSLLTTMTTCHLQVGQAADLAFDDGVRARTRAALDVAVANLRAIRAMPADPIADDDRHQQAAAIRSTWFALEEAARIVGRPDLQPGTLSPGVHPEPVDAAAPAFRPLRGTVRSPKQRTSSRWTWLVSALVLGSLAYNLIGLLDRGVGDPAAGSPVALRSSNVAGLEGSQQSAVERAVGGRALMLIYPTAQPSLDSFRSARAAAAAYPNAVVFVIQDGAVASTAIGRAAAVPGYSDFSLIKDYFPVQSAAGTDPVAQARQLVLLYDRLSAEGSVRGAVRATFDGPDRPWVLIVVVVILALVAAALIIRFGVGAAAQRLTDTGEECALRESLSLRLAGAQQDWLEHPANGSVAQTADWARRARALQDRIATAGPAEVATLAQQIDALHAEVRRR